MNLPRLTATRTQPLTPARLPQRQAPSSPDRVELGQPGLDTQVLEMRQLALTFRRSPNPELLANEATYQRVTSPRTENDTAVGVRRDYRQAWEQARGYFDEGRRLAAAGPGTHSGAAGQLYDVSPLEDGSTRVVTHNLDGSSRTLHYDETGRVYAQNRDAQGRLVDSLYRDGMIVSTNPYPDFQETGTPSRVFNATQNGTVYGATQTGMMDWKGLKVSADGQVASNDPRAPEPPSDPSLIPKLRQSVPVTGQGVKIGVLDEVDQFRGGVMGPHAEQVKAVATDQANGVAPGASVVPLARTAAGELQSNPTLPEMADDPKALDKAMRELPGGFDPYTQRLGQILDQRDPKMRVLNISAGAMRATSYDTLQQFLEQKGTDGQYRYPNLRTQVYGNGNLSEDEQRQRVARYADPRLNDPQSAYQRSQRSWQDMTRRADEAGLSIVVAATNNQPDNGWDKASPGAYLNELAHSPSVITVGAAGQGPGGLWPDSTAGEGPGGYNPTLVAPGQNVLTKGNLVGSGTSFAAPFVSGTIALMLEANPNLSTADIKRILEASANPLPGVDMRRQGAGVINPQEAVRLAGLGVWPGTRTEPGEVYSP